MIEFNFFFFEPFAGILLFLLLTFLVFTPGLLFLSCFKNLPSCSHFFIAQVGACITPTCIFWAYYFNSEVGYFLSWIFFLGFLLALSLPACRHRIRASLVEKEFYTPLFLLLFIGIFYVSVLTLFDAPDIVKRFNLFGSSDNLIQQILSEVMLKGRSPFNLILDHYPTSVADRPPLIAAFFLANPFIFELKDKLDFVAQTMLPNLFWIGALWALLGGLKVSLRARAFFILLTAFNGCFFFYSVFTWGKMLGGSLVLGPLIFLILPSLNENRKAHWAEVILAALSTGFAAFSHGGALFFLIPVVVYLLWPKNFLGLQKILAGSLVTLLIAAPWPLLKSHHEPLVPGLLRFAVTDSETPSIFSAQISLGEALQRTYKNTGPRDFLIDRLGNFKEIFWNDMIQIPQKSIRALPELEKFRFEVRFLEISHIVRALGTMVLFLPLLVFGLFSGGSQKRQLQALALFTIGAWAFWSFAVFRMYGLSHGSLGTHLLFYALIGSVFLNIRPRFQQVAFVLQLLSFILVWVVPFRLPLLNPWMLLVSTLGVAATLLAVFSRRWN